MSRVDVSIPLAWSFFAIKTANKDFLNSKWFKGVLADSIRSKSWGRSPAGLFEGVRLFLNVLFDAELPQEQTIPSFLAGKLIFGNPLQESDRGP